MKRTKVAAIDVGTTKVCTIMGDLDAEGSLRILGVGVGPSQGLQKGLVINVNEAKEAIRDSIRKAERTAGTKLESAYIGVTGRHISSDHRVLHIIPRTYVVDGQEGVKNPVGMHGFRLDVEAHIITAAVTSVQNLTKCIRGLGVEIDDLVMEPLASAEAVLSEEERADGVMIADIGGGTTDIAVLKEDTICHTSVLPVAGHLITRDISVGLGISPELAESMKKKYGNVNPGMDTGVDSDKTLTEDGHSVSHKDLSEIIRIRVEELVRLIMMELPRTDYSRFIPAGLVLTGGSANLPGIAELAQEVARVPVRVGQPVSLFGVSDQLRDPAYATSVGLLLWKMRNQSVHTWVPQSGLRHVLSNVFKVFR
jgi:cell division protein FtsA